MRVRIDLCDCPAMLAFRMLLDRLNKNGRKGHNWRPTRQPDRCATVSEMRRWTRPDMSETRHTVQLQAEKERLRLEAEEIQRQEVRGSANSSICIFHVC